MKTVTIAQALKERSRLEERLQQYQSLINEQNCIQEGDKRIVDVQDLMKKCEGLEDKILKVRTAVAQANLTVSDKLVELDVLKKRERFIAQIPCDESSVNRSYGENLVRKEAVINVTDLLNMKEALLDRIHAIQDEIDNFNAITKVQIED